MLPRLIRSLLAYRKRLGLRVVKMAGHLGLTLREYRALEVGELTITSDLIVELCGWPR